MTRFVIIGSGWRADFFYRIANLLPEEFEITAAVSRSEEKAAELQARWGVFGTSDLAEALKKKHDFVVLCVTKAAVPDYLKTLISAGEAVLCETPPAGTVEELNMLWDMAAGCRERIQVCEQYIDQPLYRACLNVIDSGLLGEVTNMTLSALHDYHAVSVFRHMLHTGFEACKIHGMKHTSQVTVTGSRAGLDTSGRIINMERNLAVIEFESGKTAFYDFSGEQYHSMIRTRHLNIQGIRGEINDMDIRYLNEENRPVTLGFQRIDLGVYNNSEWSHQGIVLGAQEVYHNPFPGARLNDDEIAIATCLSKMKASLDGGEEAYSLRDALQDTYVAIKVKEACADPSVSVRTAPQSWQ